MAAHYVYAHRLVRALWNAVGEGGVPAVCIAMCQHVTHYVLLAVLVEECHYLDSVILKGLLYWCGFGDRYVQQTENAKRILVSHLRTWEERKEAAPKAAKKAAKEEPQVEMPKVEKTTLGDLSALAELKASMEQAEEKPAKKAAAKKTKKEE